MKKQDEIRLPSSCLNKANDEELIFVLLERDRAAVTAIRAWIEERIRLGLNAKHDKQILEAEAWCEAADAGMARRYAQKAGA